MREKIRIDVNRFCRDVKTDADAYRMNSQISLQRQQQVRSRTQFHINLKIVLTNFI